MNKSVLIALGVILLLIIGGGYFFSQRSSSPLMETGTNDGPMDIESQNTTETTSPNATGSSESTDSADVKEFTVTGSNFKFDLANITVNEGDTVRIKFVNQTGIHDLMIDEFNVATKQIGAGASETIEFVADQKGSFEYYCSVGNHRQMGMKGRLTVQ